MKEMAALGKALAFKETSERMMDTSAAPAR
jgi:hypothetical protein